ncbi:MAG: ABC transporter substrate-binding protein [Paraglaciecola chathamensis]|uniref:Signal peptide prediction n=1 Tax=Paraglaciecola agarilytica NO2 TaxID=1125747 RepID=A0ABQ0I1M7_9ALTE|nr:extracellular solute-binding protein [Paraglaciecola agarilytica]GAC03225.1 signal peptide prediction [Paraglaciecola agarilytica NO2]
MHKQCKMESPVDTLPVDKSKRNTLTTIAKGVALGTSILHAPYVFARNKLTLRVLGTHVTLQEPLRQRAMSDLGIDIKFEPKGSPGVLQRGLLAPESFDIYEQWSNSIRPLWRNGSIQPIETKRIAQWDEINSLCKTGKVTPSAKYGAGDAPFKIVNIQKDGTLGSEQTGQVSFLPYVHNVDSFGYNTNEIDKGIAYKTESWGWLLDRKYRGKVGIINDPTIGLFDLALAADASGMLKFADIGNITTNELDRLFDLLIDLKHQQHFGGFWNSVPESVDFMRTGRVNIESMFSPAVSSLNGQNVPVTFAAPKEGYRGWHGVMCLSSRSQGRRKDMAYEYMNWWLSGWPGAFIARQGYYISNPQRSSSYLEQSEWDYWYNGKPAGQPLKGPDGNISVQRGQVRSGGSYTDRFSNVAVWNTAMPTYDYTLQKWYEFISS